MSAVLQEQRIQIKDKLLTDLKICRQSHVNLLPVRSDSVQQQGVVQRAVPHSLKAVESPERATETGYGEIFNR